MKNQLNDIKSKIYRSRCSEKIKISKINKMKKNIGTYNEKNNVGIKKIDKILGNESDKEENNPNDGFDNMIPPSLKDNYYNNEENQNKDKEYNLVYDYNNSYYNKQNNNINFDNNMNNFNVNQDFINDEQNNFKSKTNNINKQNSFKAKKQGDNSVNLAELNKRIKESTDKISRGPFINTESKKDQEFNQNENNQNIDFVNNNIYDFPQEENIQNDFDIEEKDIDDLNENLRDKTYKENENIIERQNNNHFNQQNYNVNKIYNKPKAEIQTNFNYLNNKSNNINNYSNLKKYKTQEILRKNHNDFIFDKNKNIFYSLQISPNIPTNISDFGKFLISHIEKEENYKILFYKELKSFKSKIKKIFSNANSTDHCLTDYLLDIWEKIDVSFYIRYQIMKNVIKLNANDLYMFLDRETEYLTNYFQISEKIFEEIKKRENNKAKLQAKNNRNEMILELDRNKLDEITHVLEEDIAMFKNKYEGMNIVWKGIYYEWFMNYEKWFYEMEIRDDLDYSN